MEKKKKTGLPYTMYINRNLAMQITKRCEKITPNQITAIGFSILFIALVLIPLTLNTIFIVIPYLLLAFSYVLDSVDGQLARKRNLSSTFGEWLDHSLDGLRMLLLQITILISLLIYNSTESIFYIVIAFSLNIISVTSNFFFSILKQLIMKQKSGDLIKENSFRNIILKIFLTPADYGVYIMSILLLIKPGLFIKVYFLYGLYYSFIFLSNASMTIFTNVKDNKSN